MGVKTLWSIISGSGELIDLRELQGSTVAIDLAGEDFLLRLTPNMPLIHTCA